jgi:hypothetical protein
MAKRTAYGWRNFGKQARRPGKPTRKYSMPAPATNKQLRFLADLRRRSGIPLDGLNELTVDDATREITKLLAGRAAKVA